MHSISDITLISDLQSLSKGILVDLCTDLNLETSGYKIDLVRRVQDYIRGSSNNELLERANGFLLAGKTSCRWYKLSSTVTAEYITTKIEESYGFNPFNNIVIPDIDHLASTPILISAARGAEMTDIFMRFMYKSGVTQKAYGNELQPVVSTSVSTVYIDTETGIVEVRGDTKKTPQIVSELMRVLQQQVNVDEVTAPFNAEIAEIADKIDGELIDATSKPDLVLEDFDDDKIEAIGKILNGIDQFFVSGDGDELGITLDEANVLFGDERLSIPFSALILSGMDKVGLAGDGELRNLPLFAYLNPRLDHHTGFIRFTLNEDGVNKKYTIRVGRESKSIYFNTPVNEMVIEFIRRKVIL